MNAATPANVARVGDVMTNAVMFVNASQSQDEVFAILRQWGVSGAPVLGAGGKLVGIVSLSDLADSRRRMPATAGTIEDAMTRVVYAVRASDPAMAAVHLMLDEHIHRALVVNDDGTIAGIVAPIDILRALANGVDVRLPNMTRGGFEYVDLKKLP
jgi:CBS-domain-containing membrane protein